MNMTRKDLMLTLVVVSTLGIFVVTLGRAVARRHYHSHEGESYAGHGRAGDDHEGRGERGHSAEVLAFHLPAWSSMHFDDANKAARHAATVKKLRCEVKQDNHAGHIDVTYRCANWKSIQVESQELAEQWSKWLAASGFDVSHGHTNPEYAKDDEAVELRLVHWKQSQGDGLPQAKRH